MSGPMSRDDRIAAFLDGALSDADHATFEAELERDPVLAAEVERLMANDALMREAFASPIDQGTGDDLLRRMGLAPADQPPAILAANDNPPFWKRWSAPLGGAIAAALALTLMLSYQTRTTPGGRFDAALDTTPSGQIAALDGKRALRPLLTFRAGDGRYCREFSISGPSADGTGIACRAGRNWQVEALDKGATELAKDSEIALASGQDGNGLDGAYARLKAGDPLGQRDETALIAREWSGSGE